MGIESLQADLKKFFENEGCISSSSIALLVGMEQSTVYRSLFMGRPKLTKGLIDLCNYAKINAFDYKHKDPASNQYLMEALSIVWDGTDTHAKQLSKLLLTAHSCKLNGNRN